MRDEFDGQPTFEKIRRPPHRRAMPNRSKFSICSGKESFTKRRAKMTAKALNERHGIEKKLFIYRCPHGSGHYHLTSMPREVYRKYESRKGSNRSE